MKRSIVDRHGHHKTLKILVAIILIAALTLSYMFCLSPYFAAILIRAAFEKTEQSPPLNYEKVSSNIIIYNDIEYPSEFGDNALDIYLPKNIRHPLETIIFTHGGGYVGGDKHETRYLASSLAANGYAVVSHNYERAPEANYPAPLVQLGEVIEYIKSENPYLPDATSFVFAGSSAGAHCAAQFVAIQHSEEYSALVGIKQVMFAEEIKAVLLFCGPYDFETFGTQSSNGVLNFMMGQAMCAYFGTRDWRNLYGQQATLKYHVTSDFPPTFITDGNKGSFEHDGKDFEQALRDLGVITESYYIDGNDEMVGHEYQYNMHTTVAEISFMRTISFLDKYT